MQATPENFILFNPVMANPEVDQSAQMFSLAAHCVMTIIITAQEVDLKDPAEMKRLHATAYEMIAAKAMKLFPSADEALSAVIDAATRHGLQVAPWLTDEKAGA